MKAKANPVKIKPRAINPAEMPQPGSAADFLRRGMAYYARRQFDPAVEDLTKAIELDSKNVDVAYALAMVFKAKGDKIRSEELFQKVISLIDAGAVENMVSAHMLKRLALGEINSMTKGDWDLAKETWQRV